MLLRLERLVLRSLNETLKTCLFLSFWADVVRRIFKLSLRRSRDLTLLFSVSFFSLIVILLISLVNKSYKLGLISKTTTNAKQTNSKLLTFGLWRETFLFGAAFFENSCSEACSSRTYRRQLLQWWQAATMATYPEPSSLFHKIEF